MLSGMRQTNNDKAMYEIKHTKKQGRTQGELMIMIRNLPETNSSLELEGEGELGRRNRVAPINATPLVKTATEATPIETSRKIRRAF